MTRVRDDDNQGRAPTNKETPLVPKWKTGTSSTPDGHQGITARGRTGGNQNNHDREVTPSPGFSDPADNGYNPFSSEEDKAYTGQPTMDGPGQTDTHWSRALLKRLLYIPRARSTPDTNRNTFDAGQHPKGKKQPNKLPESRRAVEDVGTSKLLPTPSRNLGNQAHIPSSNRSSKDLEQDIPGDDDDRRTADPGAYTSRNAGKGISGKQLEKALAFEAANRPLPEKWTLGTSRPCTCGMCSEADTDNDSPTIKKYGVRIYGSTNNNLSDPTIGDGPEDAKDLPEDPPPVHDTRTTECLNDWVLCDVLKQCCHCAPHENEERNNSAQGYLQNQDPIPRNDNAN